MLHGGVMETRKCMKCGAILVKCPECGEFFYRRNKVHIYCRARCRMRASRRKLTDLSLPD